MSCSRAQEFLAKKKISTATQVDAKKKRVPMAEALELLRSADEVYIAKGKNVRHFSLKGGASLEEVGPLLLGPTGNLRAPTLRKGRTLIVGFHGETYAKLLA